MTDVKLCVIFLLKMNFSITAIWRRVGALLRWNKAKSNDDEKTITDYRREAMVKMGHEQFQKLMDKGLRVPVGLL